MTPTLPDFERPPVIEVAISLQFRALDLLRSSHFGLLWDVFRREGFSRTEDHGEIEPAFEDFEAKPSPRVGVRVQTFDDAPPPPRVWFLNNAQDELIQVQKDRLVVNWRQGAAPEPYPRYISIRERFRFALDLFTAFAKSENLGDIEPTQCELTYVNHMPAGLGWSRHGEIGRVVTTWQNMYSDSYLSEPEDVGFRVRYRMRDEQRNPIGRLYIVVQPVYRTADGEQMLVMNLTARGKPNPTDLEGALRLFDCEHEWIVCGFASITTPHMHKIWRRKNGH